MSETTDPISYDELLSTLPGDQLESITIALRAAVAKTHDQVRVSELTVPDLPPEDSKALAAYREKHKVSAKKAKAKRIRKEREYWKIVAELRGVTVEEAISNPSGKPEAKEAIDEREPKRQAFKGDLAAATTIDGILSVAHNHGIILTDCDSGYDVAEVVAKVVSEDRDGKYSSSPQMRKAEKDAIEEIRNALLTGDLSDYFYEPDYSRGYNYNWGAFRNYVFYEITTIDDLERIVSGKDNEMFHEDGLISMMAQSCDFNDPHPIIVTTYSAARGAVFEIPEVKNLIRFLDEFGYGEDSLSDCLDWIWDEWGTDMKYSIWAEFDDDTVMSLIRKNPRYAPLFEEAEKMEAGLVSRIPEDPADAYPKARSMSRRFTLHVGPTNSGKTHDALAKLMSADSGAYLAPLRLLAFEAFEKMNDAGVPCSLLTGEEAKEVPGSRHVASTIEMLDFGSEYDVAVIDEAQMMGDPDRGHRWTAAILGAAAHEVHVCMAPEALSLVEKLIDHCGDTYEVVEHRRKTLLAPFDGGCNFPGEIEAGDAVVVFSRRSVHAVAAELEGRGHKVAMIYGALPYDVRHAQAEKFASGEADVVVATDAIGMGMNLPVKRVVFLEQAKYDGHSKRFLKASEVQQIAGRAGRYGMHDQGTFASVGEFKKIKQLMTESVPKLKTAPIGFTRSLLGAEGRVSALMSKWASLPVGKPFAKNGMEREIKLAEELEDVFDGVEDASKLDNKQLVFSFATMPFKENVARLAAIWHDMFESELEGKTYPVEIPDHALGSNLEALEDEYALLDLLFQYCRTFGYGQHYDAIQDRRDMISEKMMELLGRKGVFEPRRCRECGKEMAWNYPYPMCQKCHDRLYPPRYNDWDDYGYY